MDCYSGGLHLKVPSWRLILTADCTTPWACVTTAAGYWDYTEAQASCTAPVNRMEFHSDCSYTLTVGYGTVTIEDCTKRTPIDPGCPKTDFPYDGGTWCRLLPSLLRPST